MGQMMELQREEYPRGRRRFPHSWVAGPGDISDSQVTGAEKLGREKGREEKICCWEAWDCRKRFKKREFCASLSPCGAIYHTAASGHLQTHPCFFSMLLESDIGGSWPQVFFGWRVHALFPNHESPKSSASITAIKNPWGRKRRCREQLLGSGKCLEDEAEYMVGGSCRWISPTPSFWPDPLSLYKWSQVHRARCWRS